MTTRTDDAIRMIVQGLEERRAVIDEDMSLQDFTVKIKFKRGWPFKFVFMSTSSTEKGQ